MQIIPLIRRINAKWYWCTPLWQKPIIWSVSLLSFVIFGTTALVIAMITQILGVNLETFAALCITVFFTGLFVNLCFTKSGERNMSKKVAKLKIKALTEKLTADEQEKIDNQTEYNKTYVEFGLLAVFFSAILGGAFALGIGEYANLDSWPGFVLIGVAATFTWSVALWYFLIQDAADGQNYEKVIKEYYEKAIEPVKDKVENAIEDSAIAEKLGSMSFADVMALMSKKQ